MKNMKLSGSSKKKKETPSKGGAIKARRRLSVAAGDPRKKAFTKLDGASNDEKKRTKVRKRAGKSSGGKVFGAFCSNSNVGFVPFNPNKVNQDRACAVSFCTHSVSSVSCMHSITTHAPMPGGLDIYTERRDGTLLLKR